MANVVPTIPFSNNTMTVSFAFAIVAAFLLVAKPLATEAQQAGKKVPRIGYLSGGSDSPRDAAFRQGLRELGYIDGQNIAIEYRFADGKFERLPGFAAELVRLNVDVIVSSSAPANRAAQQATQTIPIIIVIGWAPAGAGSTTSLARPGGNTTGLTATNAELSKLVMNLKTAKALGRAIPPRLLLRADHFPHPSGSVRGCGSTCALGSSGVGGTPEHLHPRQLVHEIPGE
jgi:ABC transporter substrate binding protein